YNDEPARFVAKALSPARVREVLVDDDGKQATVIVPDDQLSLAIGREGQNARLAARLTGWRIDIKSETEFAAEEQAQGYEEEETQGRCAAVMSTGRRCPNAALPGSRYCGLDSHQALAHQPTDELVPADEEPLVEEDGELVPAAPADGGDDGGAAAAEGRPLPTNGSANEAARAPAPPPPPTPVIRRGPPPPPAISDRPPQSARPKPSAKPAAGQPGAPARASSAPGAARASGAPP